MFPLLHAPGGQYFSLFALLFLLKYPSYFWFGTAYGWAFLLGFFRALTVLCPCGGILSPGADF